MHALSVKLPTELHAALASEAQRRNITRSALLREIVGEALDRVPTPATPSCAELASDLIGAVRSGRRDLATNPDLLKQAVVSDARRAADRRR